jgi:hypothetical protein
MCNFGKYFACLLGFYLTSILIAHPSNLTDPKKFVRGLRLVEVLTSLNEHLLYS